MKWNRILILGNGFIGGYLSKSLPNSELVGSKDLDYHNFKVLGKYLLNHGVDVVINCSGFAGRPNVDQAEEKKEECWWLNVTSPMRIAQLCNTLGIRYVHISSGCIYDGYDKQYRETDKPNFGLFDYSSFYSKTKHAFEMMSDHLDVKIIRIRMPISPDNNPRNYLSKIRKYDNIINMSNSKTYIPDLCNFINTLLKIETSGFWKGHDTYNVVNPNALFTETIASAMLNVGCGNKNWKFVKLEDLEIVAPRSNCILDPSKAMKIYPMRDEIDIVKEAVNTMVCEE